MIAAISVIRLRGAHSADLGHVATIPEQPEVLLWSNRSEFMVNCVIMHSPPGRHLLDADDELCRLHDAKPTTIFTILRLIWLCVVIRSSLVEEGLAGSGDSERPMAEQSST